MLQLQPEWSIVFHNDAVQESINEFSAEMKARFLHLAERMTKFGPHLGMPHTRAMENGLFELRLKSKEGIGRVFFGLLSKKRIVLLHAFAKKSLKTPAREMLTARSRLKEARANDDV